MPKLNKAWEFLKKLSPTMSKRFDNVVSAKEALVQELAGLPDTVQPIDFGIYKEKGYDQELIKKIEKQYTESIKNLMTKTEFVTLPQEELVNRLTVNPTFVDYYDNSSHSDPKTDFRSTWKKDRIQVADDHYEHYSSNYNVESDDFKTPSS
ncbi:hypothetical protein RF11_00034 [Thelohanellus kitauei]|uniref:Uncharacterized protein n=1 Tax=Thelohanellus kitauei TaxID=669202 RepID=A0A0C2NCN6_THEKT|nr:hypothetical protein RF11_00034 [Thelohanellus kitauei]